MKKTLLDVLAVFAITAIITACILQGVLVFKAYRQADIVKKAGTVMDVDTVPADRIDPGIPTLESLKLGESCWVSIISYDVATDGSEGAPRHSRPRREGAQMMNATEQLLWSFWILSEYFVIGQPHRYRLRRAALGCCSGNLLFRCRVLHHETRLNRRLRGYRAGR